VGKNIFIRLYSLFLLASVFLFSSEIIKVASDNNQSYYKLAKSMDIILNGTDYKLVTVKTEGSTDNINQITSNNVDLAIVQSDVVFFAKNGLGIFKDSINDLKMILPLFREPIFILSNRKSINSLEFLKNKKISLGSKKSGLSLSAKTILHSAGLWNSVTIFNLIEKNALEKIKKGQLDILFVNNLTDEIKKMIDSKKLFLVEIPNNFIYKLQHTFPHYHLFKYTQKNGETTITISTDSILIGTSKMDNVVISKITDTLVKNYSRLQFPDKYHMPTKELFTKKGVLDWHQGVYNYFNQNNIIPYENAIISKYFWYVVIVSILIGILALFILSMILYKIGFLYTLKENSWFLKFLKRIYLYSIKYKYILVLIFMLISYIISILVIKYFEHLWAIEHNAISGFDENPFWKSLLWLFVFNSTGFNGDLFPNSLIGKFLMSIIPVVGLGGVMTLVGFLTSDKIKKYILESKGMGKIKFKNHIIICGWNERTLLLIRNLTHENLSEKKPLVILAKDLDFNPIDKYHLDKEYINYISGEGSDRNALLRANIEEAERVVVMANSKSSDPDARSLLMILTIERFCHKLTREKKRIGRDEIYTIVELMNKDNEQIAKDANANQIIFLGDVETMIFSQSIQTPGITKFVNEIFNYNELNDIYSIPVDNKCSLIGKNYDAILSILRKHNILLLCINIEAHRKEIEIEKIKLKYKLTREVITNPIEISEQEYKLREGDILIVLARYEEDLLKARDSISKDA